MKEWKAQMEQTGLVLVSNSKQLSFSVDGRGSNPETDICFRVM